MNEVAPRRSVRGIKLVVGETRIGAPRKGCRGLTQVEFDAPSMAGAERNNQRRRRSSGRDKKSPRRAHRPRTCKEKAPPPRDATPHAAATPTYATHSVIRTR